MSQGEAAAPSISYRSLPDPGHVAGGTRLELAVCLAGPAAASAAAAADASPPVLHVDLVRHVWGVEGRVVVAPKAFVMAFFQ
jgi:hypothetical protein